MTRKVFLIFLLLLFLIFTGCNQVKTQSTDTNNTVTINSAINERYPFFEVKSVDAIKGDKDIVVYVHLKDNPGFLTLAINIAYDSDNLILTRVLPGSDYRQYNFIGPKNMESGCTASWFVPDIPENIIDGIILELHFDTHEQTKPGSYAISVTRPENGGVVDQYKQPIVFNNATGYININ